MLINVGCHSDAHEQTKWFGDVANELMVWVDTYKQVPGGSKVAAAAMLGGHS